FFGRRDQQVKIRGVRVELGEIESVLSQHPSVSKCVAVVREDESKEKFIVVYLSGDASAAELRKFLRTKLPEYMVPRAFIELESFPLLPSGKIDRKALPDPTNEPRAKASPETEIQKKICALMAEVLSVPQVGIYDDFFELGGNSLVAMRLISRAREAIGVELEVRNLFAEPSPAGLALFISQQSGREV